MWLFLLGLVTGLLIMSAVSHIQYCREENAKWRPLNTSFTLGGSDDYSKLPGCNGERDATHKTD